MGGGGGWKNQRDKARSGQVSMDFIGRTERRGGCVGDRRRGEEARWLMKGGGVWKTRRVKGRSGQVGMYFSGRIRMMAHESGGMGEGDREEGEKRPDQNDGS